MIKRVIVASSLVFFCFIQSSEAVEPSSENQIRLGSFNIEKLGFKKEFQTENAAEILKNYDIVAIQEVMNMGANKDNPIGTKGIEALKEIVSYLGEDWDYVISKEPNGPDKAEKSRAFNTFEYYAFIFRKSKIELVKDSAYLWDEQGNPMPDLENQERQFDREPFIASFKVKNGNLDFTLMTIHAAAPAAKWRRDEIKRLQIVYDTVQASDASQNDVFLTGDFNTHVDKKEWAELKALEGMRHVLASSDVTTLDKARGRLSKSQYDTIWYQGQYSDEDVILGSAQVHQAWQEDLKVPVDIKIPNKLKTEESRQIWLYGRHASDHLPITVLLWSDRDTDSFKTLDFSKQQKQEIAQSIGIILPGMTKQEVRKTFGLLEPKIGFSAATGQEVWYYSSPEKQNIYFKDDKVERVECIPEKEQQADLRQTGEI